MIYFRENLIDDNNLKCAIGINIDMQGICGCITNSVESKSERFSSGNNEIRYHSLA